MSSHAYYTERHMGILEFKDPPKSHILWQPPQEIMKEILIRKMLSMHTGRQVFSLLLQPFNLIHVYVKFSILRVFILTDQKMSWRVLFY